MDNKQKTELIKQYLLPEKKNIAKYTQDCLEIKDIKYGMIITTDNRYVKVVEIEPVNLMMRSPSEQDSIIQSFAGWLKICPYNLQFKVLTCRADSNALVNNVSELLAKEENQKCRELGENYLEFLRRVVSQEAITRRFFIIFQYSPKSEALRSSDPYTIAEELNNDVLRLKNALAPCGNAVIPHDNYEELFLVELLYTILNRRSSQIYSCADRIKRVYGDTLKINQLETVNDQEIEIPVADYIAPTGIDFSHPSHIIIDGQYQTTMYVEKRSIPINTVAGWTSIMVNAGEGIDIDIHLQKLDTTSVRENVSRTLRLTRVKVKGRSDTDSDYEEIVDAINSGSYIKKGLANGQEFFWMQIFITVSAPTLKLFNYRKQAIVDALLARDIYLRDCFMRQEAALMATLPLVKVDKNLSKKASRNALTNGVASTYIFNSFELCDENGILLGINRYNNTLCNLDLFDSKKYKNANLVILGTSGAGKTYTEQLMALRMRMTGIQTFVILPEKGHEFKRACDHIGGEFIKIGAGSKDCINLMEIRPTVSPASELLDDTDQEAEISWLAQKSQQLSIFFKILIPDLANEEEQMLDEAIMQTYERYGITTDNDSLYQDKAQKIMKTMPIVGDLHETLLSRPETKRIATILGRFVNGSARSFNQQTNVDLNNKYIVFDLSELKGALLPVGMFIALDFVWDKVKEDRTKKKAVLIDEGSLLIGASSRSDAAAFVFKLYKMIRGFGGSAILATQDISDFFAQEDGKYGKSIISNSKTKIILNLEPKEARTVQEVLELSDMEIKNITKFGCGEALIAVNNNKIPVYVKASEKENELITTDRSQQEALLNRRLQEKASTSPREGY